MPADKRPERPGLYWIRLKSGHEQIVEIYDGLKRGLFVDWDGDSFRLDDPCWDGCGWEGPIPSMDDLVRTRTEIDELQTECRALRAECCEVRAVLKPFALVATALDGEPDDSVYEGWDAMFLSKCTVPVPTIGDVRRAAEAYRKSGS